MMQLRLMTTGPEFATLSTHEVETTTQARTLVDAHAAAHNMTKVKVVDEGDGDGLRYTATTQNGRAGRNIAYLDF